MSKELRILIVEDVPQDADAIQRELHAEALRFKAKRIETRAEFLSELDRGWADLILSDFTLPEFNALEALQLLKRSSLGIPFILVTGTRSEEVAVECLRQGADDYILKASLRRLANSIRNVLERKDAEHQRQQAEMALRTSEEQFRLIAEHSRDLIGLVSPKGTFLYANPAFRSVLGLYPAKLLNTSFFELIHPEDVTTVRRSWLAALDAKTPHAAEFRAQHRRSGWRVVEASASWILDGSGKTPQRSVIVWRDVTHRKHSEEALRSLPTLIREAQESERRRVARELHDSVIQILSSVQFRFRAAQEQMTKVDVSLQEALERSSGLLETAISEVRRISRNLRPGELDDLGLEAAVRSLAADFQERLGIPVKVQVRWSPDRQPVPKDVELNLYRIVQEALRNVEKHASANRVRVLIDAEPGRLKVVIQDDGRGFVMDAGPGTGRRIGGMGLVDIQERALLAGGQCQVESAPQRGTRIVVTVPLAPLPMTETQPHEG